MSSIFAVKMPKWGLSMEEGTITHWYSAVGDTVVEGADFVDIETSKISNTLEVTTGGHLRRLVAELDVVYPCGALLAVIADEDVPDAEIDSFIASYVVEESDDEADQVAEPTAEYAMVNALRLRYLVSGEGENVVLFLHGFGGDLDNWQFVQPLVAQNRLTVALDFPGHGQSVKDVSSLDNIESIVDLVADFLLLKDYEQVHVVGHSMGGAIALLLAKRHPGLVEKLTLLAPVSASQSVRADYLHGFIKAGRRRDMEQVIRMLFGDGDLVQRAMLDDLLQYKRMDGVPEALKHFANILLSDATGACLDGLGPLSQSISVLRGDKDEIVEATIAGDITVNRYDILKGVGHMPHMEAIPEVVSAILDEG